MAEGISGFFFFSLTFFFSFLLALVVLLLLLLLFFSATFERSTSTLTRLFCRHLCTSQARVKLSLLLNFRSWRLNDDSFFVPAVEGALCSRPLALVLPFWTTGASSLSKSEFKTSSSSPKPCLLKCIFCLGPSQSVLTKTGNLAFENYIKTGQNYNY